MRALLQSNPSWVLFYWCFFLFLGVVENLRSALLPHMKADLGLNDQELSALLMVGALASVLFQLFGGKLIDKLGQQPLYHLALGACLGALVWSPKVTGLSGALLFFFLMHMGFTLYSLLTNSLIPSLGERAGQLLTLSHGCYGLGAALSPLIAQELLVGLGGWRESYQALALPLLALWLWLCYLSPRHRQLPSLKSAERPRLRLLLGDRQLWLFSGLFGCAITAEVASSSWLVRYLTEVSTLSPAHAGYFLTGFYTLFTLMRFLGSSLPSRLGEHRALRLCLTAAGLCILAALSDPHIAGYCLALSGLSFALIFPSAVMVLNQRYQAHRAHILGVVISGALLIFMLMNALIGAFCEHISVRYSYLVMAACVGLALMIRSRLEAGQSS